MEKYQKQQHLEQDRSKTRKLPALPLAEDTEVAPGISIVRSNTPRPVSYQVMLSSSGSGPLKPEAPNFPAKAPSAPPLPEELGEREPETAPIALNNVPFTDLPKPAREEQEIFWLFEYGLEMDNSILNSPERLDGAAFLYGPAMLKGYTLLLGNLEQDGVVQDGQVVVTMAPSADPTAEIWGILYRVPRRVYEPVGSRGSLLDSIHAGGSLQSLMRPFSITVRDVYREREITCLTYCLTESARRQMRLFPLDRVSDTIFVQRLAMIARKQKLPEYYLQQLVRWASQSFPRVAPPISSERSATPLLRAPKLIPNDAPVTPVTPVQAVSVSLSPETRWLTIFAIYLMVLLILILCFSIIQGLGWARTTFSNDFKPLGVPWLVLLYGVLGGCVSSIVTLGWCREHNPPFFVILTWFTRPFIGAVLAILTYLFLTSGFFVFNQVQPRYATLCLLAGALAGLCEGWLFIQNKKEK